MLAAIVCFTFLSVIIFDCRTLLKEAGKGSKVIYFFLMLISLALLVPYSLDIAVPPLSGAIETVLDAMFHIKN